MLRRLLTCLALLTGLAAAGAPAQAEMANALASHLEVSAAAPAAVGGSAVLALRIVPSRPETAVADAPQPLSERPARQPAVRLGSDRARE